MRHLSKDELLERYKQHGFEAIYFEESEGLNAPYVHRSYADSEYRHVSYRSKIAKNALIAKMLDQCISIFGIAIFMLVLQTFEVETFDLDHGTHLPDDQLATFAFKAFPYGCLAFARDGNGVHGRFLNEWLYGCLIETTRVQLANLFGHDYRYSNISDHAAMMDIIGFKHMNRHTLMTLFSKESSPIPLILSNRYIGNLNVPHLIDYAFLTGYHPHCAEQPKQWPRPTWSIEQHRNLDPMFIRASKTLLLMSRFRFRNFPIHRDLLLLIIKHLFPLHLNWLETRARSIFNEFQQKDKLPIMELRKQLLDESGVYINIRTPEFVYDAILIKRKLLTNPVLKARYRIGLLWNLTTARQPRNVEFDNYEATRISNLCYSLLSEYNTIKPKSDHFKILLEAANHIIGDLKRHKLQLSRLFYGNMVAPYNVTDALPTAIKNKLNMLWVSMSSGGL